jgi:hypothetical protein
MERPHGRHQRDPLATYPQICDCVPQIGYVPDDIHRLYAPFSGSSLNKPGRAIKRGAVKGMEDCRTRI